MKELEDLYSNGSNSLYETLIQLGIHGSKEQTFKLFMFSFMTLSR